MRQPVPPTDPALASIWEHSHKKVHGNTQLTILIQAAAVQLGACFLHAMGCTTAVQGAGAASEDPPALQGGAFLNLR